MVRFSFLVACFVLALVAFAASVPTQAKAHGGGASVQVFSNGVRVNVNGGGFHGPSVSVNGFGGVRVRGGVSRFNQNGGVNRIGFRR